MLLFPFSGPMRRENSLEEVMLSIDVGGKVFIMEYQHKLGKMELYQLAYVV